MKIGLIGSGNMARAMARGWERPLLCTDPIAERARALADEVGGEALATNAEVARARGSPDPLPQARPAGVRRRRTCSAREGGRLDPRRDAARGPEGRVPRQARLPLHPFAARRGAPGRRRAGRGTGAGRRHRQGGGRAVRRARHARRARRPAGGRRDGADVLRARLRRPGRRGADRCRRQAGDPGRAGRRARRPDARRHGRAAAPARKRHDGDPPRGLIPRRADRARSGRARAGGIRAAFSDALDAVLEER